MQIISNYEALAQAFAAEGVATHFTLMGDGNMHWAAAMRKLDGMSTFAARHEHCARAMAMGYHLATGKVGVASVTCGRPSPRSRRKSRPANRQLERPRFLSPA